MRFAYYRTFPRADIYKGAITVYRVHIYIYIYIYMYIYKQILIV